MLEEGIWINDEKMIFYINDKAKWAENHKAKKVEKKLIAKGYKEVYPNKI